MWQRLDEALASELSGPTLTGTHLLAPTFSSSSDEGEVYIPDHEVDGIESKETRLEVQHYRILVEAITRAQSRHVMEAGVDLAELFRELLRVSIPSLRGMERREREREFE
jgi:hypothetical protein